MEEVILQEKKEEKKENMEEGMNIAYWKPQ